MNSDISGAKVRETGEFTSVSGSSGHEYGGREYEYRVLRTHFRIGSLSRRTRGRAELSATKQVETPDPGPRASEGPRTNLDKKESK